ncbi:PilZ domain-containing protein [Parasphingorhabdus sp.]|uniref:PilZ domain-containing protein n=1 Tax=Parasphingorhabdus sp. TaxID=2709688 RepID=UPI003BB0FD95
MVKRLGNKETTHKQGITREPRVRKLVKIELFAGNSGPYNSIIRNLSAFGVRATSPIDLHPGQLVEIKKTGFGKVSGTVRWVSEGEFGMQFDQSIDVDLFNFSSDNDQGHFVKKIDNGHVWRGFHTATSNKRPGFSKS